MADAGTTLVVDLEPGPAASTVPGRQRPGEAWRTVDLEIAGPKRIHPFDPAEVPLGEGLRTAAVTTRSSSKPGFVRQTSVRSPSKTTHSWSDFRGRSGKSKRTTTRTLGELLAGEIPPAPRVEDDARVEMGRRELEPALSPRPHREHHAVEIEAGAGETVRRTATAGIGRRLDHARGFELLEPIREQRPGDPRRAVSDLRRRSLRRGACCGG